MGGTAPHLPTCPREAHQENSGRAAGIVCLVRVRVATSKVLGVQELPLQDVPRVLPQPHGRSRLAVLRGQRSHRCQGSSEAWAPSTPRGSHPAVLLAQTMAHLLWDGPGFASLAFPAPASHPPLVPLPFPFPSPGSSGVISPRGTAPPNWKFSQLEGFLRRLLYRGMIFYYFIL